MTVARSPGRRWRRPRVALLLALALLVPLTALAALTGGSAVKSRAQQQMSARVERDSTELGALMAARAMVVNEYVPSSALAAAAQFKITDEQVKKTLRDRLSRNNSVPLARWSMPARRCARTRS